ncbi:MAG: hypothetical protein R3257_03925, partial [bacterium]|nr:hypothetical protein [bacterium]
MIKRNHITLILSLALGLFSLNAWAQGPVELMGKDLPGIIGIKVGELGVFRANASGGYESIPFQIDEKMGSQERAGRAWALDQGKARGNGVLEGDEALLFFLSDGGVRAGAAVFPEAKKLWEVSASGSGGPWVYVAWIPHSLPESTTRYVNYDPQQDRVVTSFYEASFSKKHPLVQDVLKIKNGSIPYDLLDRFKARFHLDIKNFFDLDFNEEGIKAKVLGTRVGPIRIIRRLSASKSLGPIKVIPKSVVDFIFYPNWVEIPTQIRNPIDGSKVLNEKTHGLSGYDFNQIIMGSDVFTNLGGFTLRLDGQNSGALKKISGKGLRWWSLQGLSGSMVSSIKNDPKLSRLGIHPYLILSNHGNRPNPPESQSGEIFIGFDLPYHKIPKGNYRILIKQVFPRKFQQGKEEEYLKDART